ncbi:MAG: hypothetical protein NT120_02050, partial [Candidatus Aenigmarchaeota archaeon]|nr:hypothetical protein [Candidatus Aenigmarchaeota archaeon]
WFSRVKGIGNENIAKVIGLIDIRKADTVSALWKFAGYHVVNGKAPKREKGGGKLEYNSRLRTMCWRVGTSLIKAKGKFYEYYLAEKQKYIHRFESEGFEIVAAAELPSDKGKRHETDKIISEGHIHHMAFRKMMKLFLACLWEFWRVAEGLETRRLYVEEHLGHTDIIKPDEMVDRPLRKKREKKSKP